MRQHTAGEWRLWLTAAPVLAVFTIAAFIFARAQNIWVDETTQLSGITLPLSQMIAWLTGNYDAQFGVPGDRMPPFSYFLDVIGWRIWGDNELAFRLYHAAITAGGILALMAAMARRYGTRAALIAGLLLALSPKLISTAVEIRAYPILLAISCAQVALIILGDVANRPRRLVLFVILGLLSGYTHYFGLIATSAYTAAIFIDARDWKAAARVVGAYVLLLILWVGLVPFVTGAGDISSPDSASPVTLAAIAAFLAQTLVSSATMVDPAVAALCFAGAGLLLALGALGLGSRAAGMGLPVRHEPAVGLVIALASGIFVTVAAGLLISHFDALAQRYSIWTLPPLLALLALSADGAIAASGRIARWARLIGTALLLIGSVVATVLFLIRADWFIHGPSRTLEAMIAQTDKPVAVLHVGDTWAWGYFPLYRAHRDSLPQWLLSSDGTTVVRITRGGDPNGERQPLSALDDQGTLLVSRVDLKTYQDLRALVAGGTVAPSGELAPSLIERGWQARQVLHRPGNFTFTGSLYERPSAGLASRSPITAPGIEERPE